MALSGDYVYSLTPNEFIDEALDILQIGADGETVSGAMYKRAYRSINLLLKQMETDGGHLWCETEGTLFIQKGEGEYDFSTAKLANVYYETTTTASAASGANVIAVTSADDIQVNDEIGVILEDNSIQWTTVASIASLNITLNDNLTQAVNSGAAVRNFRDSFIEVSRVIDVRRKESSNYEIPINFESRKDYFDLPNKEQLGEPIQAYYSRQEPFGKMYLWSTPSSAVPIINFTYERKLNIVEDDSTDIDIPNYWYNAFIYTLAVMLIPKFGGVDPEHAMWVKSEADNYMAEALGYDNPVYPIKMKMKRYG